ncbi:MAG: SPOR domain-containing protein [candidate division Zixibacteria bacterium]|nr:SPOR domain-containing protein [candidate division Zixibacteria bacterium]
MKAVPLYILGLALVVAACSPAKFFSRHPEEKQPAATIAFDPLATSADREIVPETYPIRTVRPGRAATARDSARVDSITGPIEVFRVEIFTSRLYGEANRELAIAKELFSLPIHVDYEVPYYRLRVGDFPTRTDAEQMVESIRSIGYPNAWVARAIKKTVQPPSLDILDQPILPQDTIGIAPLIPDPNIPVDEGVRP